MYRNLDAYYTGFSFTLKSKYKSWIESTEHAMIVCVYDCMYEQSQLPLHLEVMLKVMMQTSTEVPLEMVTLVQSLV